MKPTAHPSETVAVVIGVEQYAAGERWALSGPASDAVGFVEWLRARDVPVENIHLYLSTLDQNKADVEARLAARDVGVVVRGEATTTILRQVFQHELRDGAKGAKLLYVFWGGHGAMESDQDRRLFCSDARATDLNPINFSSLLHILRTRPWSRMLEQVVVVDACANYYEEMAYREGQSDVRFTRVDRVDVRVDQLVLLAAASGEEAANDPLRRTGAFSRRFLELIRAVPATEWPDFGVLAQELETHFVALLATDYTRQHPITMRWRRSDGEESGVGTYPVSGEIQAAAVEADIGIPQLRSLVTLALAVSSLSDRGQRDRLVDALPAAVRARIGKRADGAEEDLLQVFAVALRDEQRAREIRMAIKEIEPAPEARDELVLGIERLRLAIRLRTLLADAPLTPQALYALYKHSAPDPQLAPPANTLDEILECLQDMGPRTHGGLPPVIEFVERVAQAIRRDSLSEWVTRWAIGAGGAQPAVALRELLRREQELGTSKPATLCVDVSEAHIPSTTLGPHLRYWVYDPAQRFLGGGRVACDHRIGKSTKATVHGALATVFQCANELLERANETVPVAIELFVTLEQFVWEFDEWAIYLEEEESPTFGISYPLALRWVERGRSNGSALQVERRNAWRRVARQIRQRVAESNALGVYWLPSGGPPPALIEATLKQGDYGALVALQFIPAFDEVSALERKLVRAVLHGGAPFVLWRRRPPAEWPALCNSVNHHLSGGTLDEVPHRCMQLRMAAMEAAGDAPGHSLAVLWDDPDRNPLDVLLSHHSQRTP